MTVTYTTGALVASLLGITTPTGSTDPTLTEVEDVINRNEDYIDEYTGHAWKTNTSTLEYYDIDSTRINEESAIPIKLRHRTITTLASGTDTLEVWEGSSWTDFLTAKTEARGSGDYWVNYTTGILYIYDYPSDGSEKVRIKYRYGESSVPGYIEDACTKLTASDLLAQDDRSFLLPEGASNIPVMDKARRWRSQALKILAEHCEFRMGFP